MLDVAIEAAKSAGGFLRKNLGKVRQIHQKGGQEKNLVTEIDKQSEAMIIGMIQRHFPSHAFLGEESGRSKPGSSGYTWVIDPLDGTTNYTHGLPVFCVSIGLEYQNEIVLGVIYDPNNGELFTAEKGRGSFLNGKRISVSKVETLSRSLLVTGFPYSVADNPGRAVEHFIQFLFEGQAVRRMGSAAIDLAYVAAGRYDGFWEVELQPWDMAAGSLLVTEAGGRVTDFEGDPFDIYKKTLVASNGAVHDEMLGILRKNL